MYITFKINIKKFINFLCNLTFKKTTIVCLGALTIIVACSSCKKVIENQAEKYILGVMTDGLWFLESVKNNGDDITNEFSGYTFKFHKAGNLDAITGQTTKTGSWSGDLGNLTFTSNFTSAGFPLERLNRVWKIRDYYPDYVIAESNTSTGLLYIKFKKK